MSVKAELVELYFQLANWIVPVILGFVVKYLRDIAKEISGLTLAMAEFRAETKEKFKSYDLQLAHSSRRLERLENQSDTL